MVVTVDEATEALGLAYEILFARPDREKAFLSAGSRSSMPQPLRIEQSDYNETRSRFVPQLWEIAWQERVMQADSKNPAPVAVDAIPGHLRKLVEVRIVSGLYPGPAGTTWADIGRRVGMREDAARKAFKKAMELLAKRMTAMGIEPLPSRGGRLADPIERQQGADGVAFGEMFAAWLTDDAA